MICHALTGGARAPAGAGSASGQAHELASGRLPRRIRASLWNRHAHLFHWNERRRCLELAPSTANGTEWVTGNGAIHDGDDCDACDGRPGFSSLVGLEDTIGCLRTATLAAQREDRPLRPVLLSGPPGLGKTALARAVAGELGVRSHFLQGPLLRDAGVLAGWLGRARRHDIHFIDEIHAVPQGVCEVLYEVLDRGTLTLPVTLGLTTRTVTIELEPVSILGATTHLAGIPEALRSRFLMQQELDFYDEEALAAILARRAESEGLLLEPDARQVLARASKGTPRRAIGLLLHAADVASATDARTIDAAAARGALREAKVDCLGLDALDRKILRILRDARRPIALGRLAARVGLPVATLRDVVEPFLLRAGLIDVTARGRIAC